MLVFLVEKKDAALVKPAALVWNKTGTAGDY